jgi:hypothetical protein
MYYKPKLLTVILTCISSFGVEFRNAMMIAEKTSGKEIRAITRSRSKYLRVLEFSMVKMPSTEFWKYKLGKLAKHEYR